MAKSRARKLADLIVGAGIDIDGNLTFDGGSVSADLTFGDDDKANFGDASDLQIWHNGTHSFIKDAGTGDLYIGASSNLALMNSAFTENYLLATSDGAVNLYYDGNKKFETVSGGVLVSGDVRATNWFKGASDTNTLYSDTSNGTLIQTPSNTNDAAGTFKIRDSLGVVHFSLNTNTNASSFHGGTISSGDITSSGINLTGVTASSSPVMRFTGTGNASAGDVIGQIEFYNSDTTDNTAGIMGKIRAIAGASGGEGSIQILTDMPSEGADAATVAAHFNGNGNVGIGTTSPTELLTVSKTSSGSITQIASLVNPVGTTNTGVRLWMSGTNTTTRGTFIDAVAESTANNHSLRFGTSASSATPTERMRIDHNGDWIVSNTNPRVASYFSTQAGMGWYEGDLHAEIATTNDRSVLELGRNNANDGDVLTFRKQSNVTGAIGVASSDNLYIQASATDHTGLLFADNTIAPRKNGANSDGGVDLGTSAVRFKDIRLSGTAHAASGVEVITSGNLITHDYNNLGTYVQQIRSYNDRVLILSTKSQDNNNYISFETQDTERMRIDYNGRVGIHATPKDWYTTEFRALQIGAGATFYGRSQSGDADKAGISANAYYDATNTRWQYMASDNASRYDLAGSAHFWYTAPSGTADAAITWTQSMTLTSDSYLGIGETLPDGPLHVKSTGHGSIFEGTTGDVGIVLHRSDGSGTVDYGYLQFKNSTGVAGQIVVRGEGSASGKMQFFTRDTDGNVTERIVIKNTGNVGIGETDPDRRLHVNSGTPNVVAKFESTDPTAAIDLTDSTSSVELQYTNGTFAVNHGGTGDISFQTTETDSVFISNQVHTASENSFDLTLYNASIANMGPRLRLRGGAQSTSVSRDSAWSDPDSNQFEMGSIWFDSTEGGSIYAAGMVGYAESDFNTGDNPSALAFYTTPDGTSTNAERMRIESSGFISVNTYPADSRFHILEGTRNSITLKLENYLANANGAVYDSYQELRFSGNSTASLEAGIRQYANNWHNGDTALAFWTSQHGGSYAERMRIDGDGNVGIGTSTPQTRLDIQTATAGTVASTVANGTNAGIYLEDDQTPTNNYFVSKIHNPGNGTAIGGVKFAVSPDGVNYSWAGMKAFTSTSGNAGELAFFTSAGNTSADSSTEYMRILSNGNIGFGTSAPAASLHIKKAGDAFIVLENTGAGQTMRIDQNSIRTTTSSPINIFAGNQSNQLYLSGTVERVGINTNSLTADGLTIGTAPNGNCELDLTNTSGTRFRLTSQSTSLLQLYNVNNSSNKFVLGNGSDFGGAFGSTNIQTIGSGYGALTITGSSGGGINMGPDSGTAYGQLYADSSKVRLRSIGNEEMWVSSANRLEKMYPEGHKSERTAFGSIIGYYHHLGWIDATSSDYTHVKTSVSRNDYAMIKFIYEGYGYSSTNISGSLTVYTYAPQSTPYQPTIVNGGNNTAYGFETCYYSSDNYLVIVLQLIPNGYAGGQLWAQNNDQHGDEEVSILAYTGSSSTTGAY